MTADPSSQSTSSSGPRIVGEYELLVRIGRGGMGAVYLGRKHAQASGLGRLVAIKVLHPHLAEDEDSITMFLDEAQLASRLHHPNTVAVLDIGRHEETPYVVMEYVEGAPLSALLKRSKEERPPRLIVPVIIDALLGLHAAHTLEDDDGTPLNLVHRDVSPGNILVGTDGRSRITDFGVAKAEARVTHTKTGVRKGKLDYMSPEQLTSPKEVDWRSDIFAAGVILWNALTGKHLFRGENAPETMHKLLNKEIPPPSEVGLQPPSDFDDICLRALERDREKRYQSAEEMADALRDAALASEHLGPVSEVSNWIRSQFDEHLQQRRQAIRKASERRNASPGDQHTGTFASLPSLTMSGAPGTQTSVSSAGQPEGASRRWLVPLLSALIGGVVVAGVLLWAAGDSDSPATGAPTQTASPAETGSGESESDTKAGDEEALSSSQQQGESEAAGAEDSDKLAEQATDEGTEQAKQAGKDSQKEESTSSGDEVASSDKSEQQAQESADQQADQKKARAARRRARWRQRLAERRRAQQQAAAQSSEDSSSSDSSDQKTSSSSSSSSSEDSSSDDSKQSSGSAQEQDKSRSQDQEQQQRDSQQSDEQQEQDDSSGGGLETNPYLRRR
jgi:serine/threonine-protein kinase